MPFKHLTMRPRKGKPQWVTEKDKTWSIESIDGGPEGGIPFVVENFGPITTGSTSDLRYTGSNQDAWFDDRTVTFNMKVSPSEQLHPLKATLQSSARRITHLAARVRSMRDDAAALTRDLDALLEDLEETQTGRHDTQYDRS